ncbi:MAG TPA: CotH kinase family protein [Verrucomicrobiota bacterium]|nr:CotH kinase family protein [Verrucomicrobiota bacterium]HNU51140.1 CotH kinase family protein [Verrucomicrobiota bacterium]
MRPGAVVLAGVLVLAVAWAIVAPTPRVRIGDTPRVEGPAGGVPALRPALNPGDEIFREPTVLDFHIRLAPTNRQALRQRPRDYAAATVVVNGVEFTNVAVKLKGAAGSYRGLDDHPALTVSFAHFVENRRLFGLRRLHLNNSVQDPSYLNEYVGSELFRAAGVPTPRVAWAVVRLDGDSLGLYVLKEAFEKEFLRCHFTNPDGNLYDGGFVSDVDQELERDLGSGPADHSDLRALTAAARDDDAHRRWTNLQRVLDVECFARYAALSVMLGDWDGYPLNRNNYRVYFNPADGRAVFFPHGLDQLFQRSSMALDSGWSGLVAWGLFGTEPGWALYEAQCRDVFAGVFTFERISNLVERAAATLARVQPDMPQIARSYTDQVAWRLRSLRRDPLLKPPEAASGGASTASQAAAR